MGTTKKSKTPLILTLMDSFRIHGYGGLTLSKISESTSLGKASLYHHFPGGKEQMGMEVIDAAKNWIKTEIYDVLTSEGEPKSRLKSVLKKFDAFYECGTKPCILEAMVASDAPEEIKISAKEAFEMLLEGFKILAEDLDNSTHEATTLAENAVIHIQGALIVSRGTLDKGVFRRALSTINLLYLKKE